MRSEKPRLCVVGHLLGRNPGYVTTQGQVLADHFTNGGYDLVSSSSRINRMQRLVDVVLTVLRNRKKIDLMILEVYSGLSFVMADAASLLGSYLRIPMIGVLHGGNLPQFSKRFPRWISRVVGRFDQIVAPSTFLVREMARQGRIAKVIPNIIDVSAYPHRLRRSAEPRLLWMRAFHPIYNPEMALRVFDLVHSVYPAATMVMAGVDKGLEGHIKAMSREMGLNDAVRFPGFLDREAKIKEFSKADIYLNTNRIDNMPVSVVEACAMGLPVVATDVGGLRDLITHGENGLLVPDGDVEAMASAVNQLLTNADLVEHISKNGGLLAERSTWANVQKAWEEVFAELLDRKCRQKNNIKAELLETSSG